MSRIIGTLLLLAGLASAGINVSSPSSTSVSSPVRFVVSASAARPVTHMKIYVDYKAVYSVSASKIDTSVSMSSGTRKVTVQAWDSAGNTMKYPMTLSVTSSTSTSSSSTSGSTTHYRIEEKSGWVGCSACANAGGGSPTSMTQGINSPSLDGNSAKFFLGGTTPWSHALYYKRVGESSTATNFVYEVNYYFTKPSASGGMEFSASQRNGYKWYRWDTQCSFVNSRWRLWDNANVKWRDTSIPCTRPSAYKWTKVVFEGKRSSGKVVFVSITVNGKKYYLNRSYYPRSMSNTSKSITVHFQLNGNAYQTDYLVWGDRFSLKYW